MIGENVNIVKRSRSSACEMYWKPRLTSPTTYSSGTNTSSMKTSLVRSSPIVQMPVDGDAGLVERHEHQRDAAVLVVGSVRVPSQYHSAKCAEVVHVFWPLSIQPGLAVAARRARP